MCDTVSILSSWTENKNESFFAKNSDREPGEEQILQFVSSESLSIEGLREITGRNLKPEYIKANYDNFSSYLLANLSLFKSKYKPFNIVISRPVWLWGGEIGVNEKGVAIGNEAVFPKLNPCRTAILGMDILRLALHLSATAEEAKDFICSVVSEYGQAGDGGYRHRSVYHNSFLIQDKNEAYVVETAGKEWAAKRAGDYCTISNTYLSKDEYGDTETWYSSGEHPGTDAFKKKYENKIFNYFAKGELRNSYKNSLISGLKGKVNLGSVKSIMRSHIKGKNSPDVKRGMASICIHSGLFIKSETTASLIVHYINNKFIIWYTGSSFPCISLYKPLIIAGDCTNLPESGDYNKALEIHKKRQYIAVKSEHDYPYFLKRIKPVRDKYEKMFMDTVYKNIENKTDADTCSDIMKCHELEDEYLKEII
ncbi:MAG: hypothetical protein GXP33_01240 [Spirochaetes bacterium]|nr:hypothetical protein [Spirochaetota bacterium]